MSAVSALLEVRGLSVSFPAANRRVAPAVRDVGFAIAPGEPIALVGESGSGKSVTSLAIMRLLAPQARVEGSIKFEGAEITTLPEEEMRRLRGRKIAMIFQEPMTALNPVMRVGDQIAEAVLAHAADDGAAREGTSRISKPAAWQRAVEAMKTVSIAEADRRARDYPHQLSGGMRQRVMIAMAVVNHPALLIADEPTTALDVTIQAQILELLAELRHKFRLAMLFVSHDLAVVSDVAGRVIVMYAGCVVESAPTRDIFRAAAHPYTRGLLNSVPTLRTDRSRPLRAIEGSVPAITALPPGCAFGPRCGLRIEACERQLPPLIEITPGHWARCPVVQSAPAAVHL